MRLAFVFPGQGSQRVGMGRDWAEAFASSRQVFQEADEALGFELSRLCWEGPEEELQLTANTQPALLATSIAMLRPLNAGGVAPAMVAGHSLGEYSALVAAGALELADALRLVRRRGELMQDAVPVGQGAMAAILGLDAATVAAIASEAAEGEVCAVANFNAPSQTVVAGHRGAVERAAALARERGARRTVFLPVSAPFHSPLMAAARSGLAPLIRATAFADPSVPVVTNIDAVPVTSAEAARDALVRQVDGPVRWVESVERLEAAGIEASIEVGPGRVLSGLVRRIAPALRALPLEGPDAVPALVEELGGGA